MSIKKVNNEVKMASNKTETKQNYLDITSQSRIGNN